MLNANNPAVNLETRTFLRGLIDSEEGLDKGSVDLLEKVLEKVKDISPSGWVFMLAQAQGASFDAAIKAASFSELYYAMCSFTDDVQDNDAAQYMHESDNRILINTLAQIICVTVVRGLNLSFDSKNANVSPEILQAFLNGAVMLRGQRIEITRQNWSVARYKTVALLSGARQFDVYFRMASLAAKSSPEPFLRLSNPLGILIQVWHDKKSKDERLLGLPEDEVESMVESARENLITAGKNVPQETRALIENMIEFACKAAII